MKTEDIKHLLDFILEDKKFILILGFAREGRSSYHLLRTLYPCKELGIADRNVQISKEDTLAKDAHLSFFLGEDYLQSIDKADYVLKSPGISLKDYPQWNTSDKISSQTNLFLQIFHQQIIGITGTKGKSTTSSLTYHILRQENAQTLLAGNIGTPLFDIIPAIETQSWIVCEFSSHQLEYIHYSPHIAVLLNLFEEHLDHYTSYQAYQNAKLNIVRYQQKEDIFIYDPSQKLVDKGFKTLGVNTQVMQYGIQKKIKIGCSIEHANLYFTNKAGETEVVLDIEKHPFLLGEHNLLNLMAAINIAKILHIDNTRIQSALSTFVPLEHRLEFVCCKENVYYYNDSISTIPEATIAAIKAIEDPLHFKKVGCLILGGFDRGINYAILIDYLQRNPIKNIIFVGNSGLRIFALLKNSKSLPNNYLISNNYDEIVSWCKQKTPKGEVCLLSPASASYDSFKNFEERGRLFKELVLR
ncbi:MAG: UDP-N-acetylmuramoyl-L-alanine--D-glutamate ligase [Bacteroidales bacterium]